MNIWDVHSTSHHLTPDQLITLDEMVDHGSDRVLVFSRYAVSPRQVVHIFSQLLICEQPVDVAEHPLGQEIDGCATLSQQGMSSPPSILRDEGCQDVSCWLSLDPWHTQFQLLTRHQPRAFLGPQLSLHRVQSMPQQDLVKNDALGHVSQGGE